MSRLRACFASRSPMSMAGVLAFALLVNCVCGVVSSSVADAGGAARRLSSVSQMSGTVGLNVSLVPVVIVPALLGSRLELSWDHPKLPFYCEQKADWRSEWLNEDAFLPFAENCFEALFRLELDPTTNTSHNPKGVNSRVVDFGGTEGVEFMDAKSKVPMWHFLLSNLTAAGYTVGQNLVAAPYDWRYGPSQYGDYFAQLRQLVERISSQNGNQPVALMSLSMGGPVGALFLAQQSQAWKDQYIRLWYSFSGVFSGSSKAILSILSLEKHVFPAFVNLPLLRDLARTMPSVLWLLPNTVAFPEDRVWVRTNARNYTTVDLAQMLSDAALPDVRMLYEMQMPFPTARAPGVETHCSYGVGVATDALYTYAANDATSVAPIVTAQDGDGVVLTESLALCDVWRTQQPQPTFSYVWPGLPHAADIMLLPPIQQALNVLLSASTTSALPP